MKLRLSTFMDVYHGDLALANAHTGHLVDDLRDIFVGLTLATSSIADSRNGKFPGTLCNATEVRVLRSRLPLSTIERVEYFERSVSRKSEGESFADTVVNLGFERNDGWDI